MLNEEVLVGLEEELKELKVQDKSKKQKRQKELEDEQEAVRTGLKRLMQNWQR